MKEMYFNGTVSNRNGQLRVEGVQSSAKPYPAHHGTRGLHAMQRAAGCSIFIAIISK